MPVDLFPRVTVLKGHAIRLRRGYPWLFSNEVNMNAQTKALPPGTLVSLYDAGGEGLGTATFNPHSLIAARLLSHRAETRIDIPFLTQRLQQALSLRTALFPDSPFYRLIHSEADGLPGLILDRYNDILSLQSNTAGMQLLQAEIIEACLNVLSPQAIVVRNESPVRALEGLVPESSVPFGSVTEAIPLEENGVRFFADLVTGQKTGWFFDQRPNRAFIATLARQRTVLDVFSYAGGFGITAAAHGALKATLVDRSGTALALARRSAQANALASKVETIESDGFSTLETLHAEGRRFGVVIADPPAFAKTKKDIPLAAKGYRKMARLAASLVEPGGFLLCGSCSHHIDSERFFTEVMRGVTQAERTGQVLWCHGAGPDHPVHPLLPESAYLKTIVLALDQAPPSHACHS